MKYITTQNESGELEIFTFPDSVNHDCMAEALRRIKNHTHEPWRIVMRIPVSAGFVNASGICLGESETLDLKSAGSEDTELLRIQR